MKATRIQARTLGGYETTVTIGYGPPHFVSLDVTAAALTPSQARRVIRAISARLKIIERAGE